MSMIRQAFQGEVRAFIGLSDTQVTPGELDLAINKALIEFSLISPVRAKRLFGTQIECHKVEDLNPVTTPDCTETTTAITLLNALKTAYNTHRIVTAYHRAADSTNAITSPDATDWASALTLAAEMITDMNAHQILAGVHMVDDETNRILKIAPVDEQTLVDVTNVCKAKYNAHLSATTDGKTIYLEDLKYSSSGFLFIEAVEFPLGLIPASHPQFRELGEYYLRIESGVPVAVTGQLLAVFWAQRHYIDDTYSSVPVQYEPVVSLGAQAYAMILVASKTVSAALTDLESARTDLGAVAFTDAQAALAKITTHVEGATSSAKAALDKIALYLETNTNGNSKALLEQIKTDVADLRTAMHAATGDMNTQLDSTITDLGGVSAPLGKVDTALGKVATYLETNPNGSAKALLEKILTDLASLRTAINTAADAVNSHLDAVVTTDFTDIGTALGDVDTALDKIIEYVETNTNGNAKLLLENIKTDIADLKTAVNTAADAMNSALDEVDTTDFQTAEGVAYDDYVTGTTEPAMNKYLVDGDAKLEAVSVAGNAAEGFRRYAETVQAMTNALQQNRVDALNQAGKRVDQAIGFGQEVAARLSHLKTYIDQSEGWGKVAMAFVSEAEQRLSHVASLLRRTEQRINAAMGYAREMEGRIAHLRTYIEEAGAWDAVARGFVDEAQAGVNEVMAIIQQAGGRRQAAEAYGNEAQVRMGALATYIQEAGGWTEVAKAFALETEGRIGSANQFAGEAAQRLAIEQARIMKAQNFLGSSERELLAAKSFEDMGLRKASEFRTRLKEIDMEKRHQEEPQSLFCDFWL